MIKRVVNHRFVSSQWKLCLVVSLVIQLAAHVGVTNSVASSKIAHIGIHVLVYIYSATAL